MPDTSKLEKLNRELEKSEKKLRESHPHDIQITKEAPNYSYHS